MQCKKWITLPKEISREYNIKPIFCKTCKRIILPFFIHDDYGDYTCYVCEQSGDLKYFCMSCKKKK